MAQTDSEPLPSDQEPFGRRILYVSRRRDPGLDDKLRNLAAEEDLSFTLIRPARPADKEWQIGLTTAETGFDLQRVNCLGTGPEDPWGFYQTLTFGLKTIRPALVHAEETPGSLAALQVAAAVRCWATSARLVWHVATAAPTATGGWRQKLAALVLRRAAGVIHASAYGAGRPAGWQFEGPSAVIPFQGVDTGLFRPLVPTDLMRPFTVAYIGDFTAARGVDLLVDAVARLDETVRLRLVGDGREKDALAQRAATAGLAGRFEQIPSPATEHLPELYGEVDVVVLPSRTGMGQSESDAGCLLEAMACKKPVIGATSGVIPEIIGDAGFTFPAGDSQALADAIQQVQDSPMLRLYMSERGYTRVCRRYARKRVAEQTTAFYRRLLKLPDPHPHEPDS
ncbi:MAG: glycosyltransferase family 4 protein [Acidobacteria bacterium]|nr:glycosyltransferase family 4 protein [Acidobacteriota bacterium]